MERVWSLKAMSNLGRPLGGLPHSRQRVKAPNLVFPHLKQSAWVMVNGLRKRKDRWMMARQSLCQPIQGTLSTVF
jgi:hypothetical protein